jgi:hypothetical protein
METLLEYTPLEGEEVLVINADFTPLQLDTMTKEDITKMEVHVLQFITLTLVSRPITAYVVTALSYWFYC